MQILKNIFSIMVCLIVFSGCISTKDKYESKKTFMPDKSLLLQKRQDDCAKYTRIMNYASSYVADEFNKAYFLENNIVGAKAQLFLIENQSKSIFAQNINAAENSYLSQFKIAKKHNCKLENFIVSPLMQIKNTIKQMENE